MSTVGAFLSIFLTQTVWSQARLLRYLQLSPEWQIGVGQMNSAKKREGVLGKTLIHLILICRFHACKFTQSLKCVCDPKIYACGAFAVSHSLTGIQWWKIWVTQCECFQLTSNKATLCLVSAHTVNKFPFHDIFSSMVFAPLWGFCLFVCFVIMLLKLST